MDVDIKYPSPLIIKSDGTEEKYSSDKIVVSLIKAGIPAREAITIAENVTCMLRGAPEITTGGIRAMVMKHIGYQYPEAAKLYQNETIMLRTTKGTIEKFDPQQIQNSLITEARMSEKDAKKVAKKVEKRLLKMKLDKYTTQLVREVTSVVLLEDGFEDARRCYARLGMPVFDVKQMIERGNKDNANLQHNPETIHKHAADQIMKDYLFTAAPSNIVLAHHRGEIHLHDADYFMVRPNCLMHQANWFFENGLRVDGSGDHTSVSAAAKSPMVAILHVCKSMASSQVNMAGGQGVDHFNVYMAPFLRGLSHSEIKQLAQAFVFEMNQLYVARGGQTVFSTINLELEVPGYLRDAPAIGCGGKVVGTYGDYETEAKIFLDDIIDVLLEGDAVGKPHLFPNTIVKVRDGAFTKHADTLLKVHQLFAKYGSPYILNMMPDYQHEAVNAMGCRTRLSGDWADKQGYDSPTQSVERCGNLQYITVNLPRIAYESNGNEDLMRDILNERIGVVKDALVFKHDLIRNRLDSGILPFLAQKGVDGKPYYQWDDLTHTIGFVGLNEMAQFMTGKEIHEDRGSYDFGMDVVKCLKQSMDEMTAETGWRCTLTQTPAETTAGRFAKLDLKDFDGHAIVQGDRNDPNSVFYTNSSHLSVSADVPLYERAKKEGEFHPICNGGHIAHLFLGEAHVDAEALMSLTEKLCKNTNLGLFDYAKEITTCNHCHKTSSGLNDVCPNCGSTDVSQFARITGYTQNVSGFNSHKRSEIRIRRKYGV